jgi:hypothetical protein
MGAWGPGLFSDDTTSEVRDAYVDNLKQGLADDTAFRGVLEQYKDLLHDHDVACLVYFALADTAWRYGRLHPSVRSQALKLLSQGGDLSVWERDSPADASRRRKVLRDLTSRLQSPQPPRKPVKIVLAKPKKVWTTAAVGTVFLLPLPSGSNAALVLVGYWENEKSIDPIFSLLRWRGTAEPAAAELKVAAKTPISLSDTLGPQKHIGIFPLGRRKDPMIGLIPTSAVVETPMPFDELSTLHTQLGVIAKKADEALADLRSAP